MSILEINNIKFNYKDNELYNEASLRVFKEDHVGLIGANGSGKSTLLNLISHKLDPDSGTITWDSKTTFSYLDQYLKVHDDITINDYLYKVYDELFREEEKMNKLYASLESANEADYDKILNRAYKIQEYLDENEFYQIKSKIGNIINGLGITFDPNYKLKNLSGGQRAKVFLGKMLLEEKDCLLLDEPTNFLDVAHVEWLTKYLQTYPKSFIVISHNIDFINDISNCIVELSNKKLTKYKGDYLSYLEQKELNEKTLNNQYEAQQKYIKKTQEFIDKNLVRATTTKRAQSRQKELDKIVRIEKPIKEKPVKFKFQTSHTYNSEAIRINNLEIGYNKSLVGKINYKIRCMDKIVITGKNGVGKSTFLKTILGIIPPIGGTYFLNPLNKITYFSQELDTIPSYDAIQFFKDKYPLMNDVDIRTLLGQYGITGELAKRPLDKLSGGELTKVRFALLSLEKSNLLVLDEPTNHLDKLAKESLFKAINNYEGTVLIVSHEKEFYSKLNNMKELNFTNESK